MDIGPEPPTLHHSRMEINNIMEVKTENMKKPIANVAVPKKRYESMPLSKSAMCDLRNCVRQYGDARVRVADLLFSLKLHYALVKENDSYTDEFKAGCAVGLEWFTNTVDSQMRRQVDVSESEEE